MSIYDFTVKDYQGEEVDLSRYRGKLLLVVNTATRCGLTPQYTALEHIYKHYKAEGFEILDFPCNQFGEQAPETDEEINQFCRMNYHTTFPRFQKIQVNGPDTHPLFAWLKEQASNEKQDKQAIFFEQKIASFLSDLAASDLKWNFTKFLLDREGYVLSRYSPAYAVTALEQEIGEVIGK